MRESLWPQPSAPFGELESLFAETLDGWRTEAVSQGPEESRADFDQRLALLKTTCPSRTVIVCIVCELKGGGVGTIADTEGRKGRQIAQEGGARWVTPPSFGQDSG